MRFGLEIGQPHIYRRFDLIFEGSFRCRGALWCIRIDFCQRHGWLRLYIDGSEVWRIFSVDPLGRDGATGATGALRRAYPGN
jgi:hypothetical protein